VKKQQKQTPAALEKALQPSIQGTRHAIKFIAGFVLALLKTRTSNLAKVAVAVETKAETASTYRQIQRFLDNRKKVEIDYFGLMKISGKVTIAIDRTEWKFGERWINILTLSVVYRQIAIPIMWHTINQKGNASAAQHMEIIQRFIAEFGTERISKVLADREFGSRELFEFLLSAEIDFLIRLKSNHLADGMSFKKRWGDVGQRVKLRGKVKTKVFGLEIYVSRRETKKGGQTRIFDCGKRQAK